MAIQRGSIAILRNRLWGGYSVGMGFHGFAHRTRVRVVMASFSSTSCASRGIRTRDLAMFRPSRRGVVGILLCVCARASGASPTNRSAGIPAFPVVTQITTIDTTDTTAKSPSLSDWETVVLAGITLSEAQREQMKNIHTAHLARVAEIAKAQKARTLSPAAVRQQIDALGAAQWKALRDVLDSTQQGVLDRTRSALEAQTDQARAAALGKRV
jgi:hypothetical protein